jgi:multidrug resistance efflux pump
MTMFLGDPRNVKHVSANPDQKHDLRFFCLFEEAALNQITAKLARTDAQLRLDAAELERMKSRTPQNFISQREYDACEFELQQDHAEVNAAKATLNKQKVIWKIAR